YFVANHKNLLIAFAQQDELSNDSSDELWFRSLIHLHRSSIEGADCYRVPWFSGRSSSWHFMKLHKNTLR
ncbi:MAG: hypothetical protein ACKO8C_03990, partial [Candidatus Nanopelagicaceae bacterium]